MAVLYRTMCVIMLRIVLSQQVPAVVIAVWRAHHRMDVITGRCIIVVHDAGLVVELDEKYRAEDSIVKGARIIERANPSEVRLAQVALRLVVADLSMTLT